MHARINQHVSVCYTCWHGMIRMVLPVSSFSSSCSCACPLHQMLELARLLHVHALLIPPPVECLVQQSLTLHEVNLQRQSFFSRQLTAVQLTLQQASGLLMSTRR